jgi:hypothetical protein
MKLSIQGGHEYIITYIYEQGHLYDNFLDESIEYHHNDICLWLLEQFTNLTLNIDKCIEHYNVNLLFNINYEPTFYEENKNSFLLSSSHYGNLIVLRYLLSKESNVQFQNKNIFLL